MPRPDVTCGLCPAQLVPAHTLPAPTTKGFGRGYKKWCEVFAFISRLTLSRVLIAASRCALNSSNVAKSVPGRVQVNVGVYVLAWVHSSCAYIRELAAHVLVCLCFRCVRVRAYCRVRDHQMLSQLVSV